MNKSKTPTGGCCPQPPRSVMDRLVDEACEYVPEKPKLTEDQKEAARSLGDRVISNIRYYYPSLLENAPATASIHIRNTIASEVEQLLLKNT